MPGYWTNTCLLPGIDLLCGNGRCQFTVDETAEVVVFCWLGAGDFVGARRHVVGIVRPPDMSAVSGRNSVVFLFTGCRIGDVNRISGCIEARTSRILTPAESLEFQNQRLLDAVTPVALNAFYCFLRNVLTCRATFASSQVVPICPQLLLISIIAAPTNVASDFAGAGLTM